jgi:hypothetical protein
MTTFSDAAHRVCFVTICATGAIINPAIKCICCSHSGESRNLSVLSWMPDQVRHDAFAYLIAGLIMSQGGLIAFISLSAHLL